MGDAEWPCPHKPLTIDHLPIAAHLLPAGRRRRIPGYLRIPVRAEPDPLAVQDDFLGRDIDDAVEPFQPHPVGMTIGESHVGASSMSRLRSPFRPRLVA